MKPMEASDWKADKVKFPVWMQPKYDGVRGMNLTEKGLTGRSLKPHGNKYVTNYFSGALFRGFDGEFAGAQETASDLCRVTSSLIGTHEGNPWLLWHLFDYITPETRNIPYHQRYAALESTVHAIKGEYPDQGQHLHVVPVIIVDDIDELIAQHQEWVSLGYEGSILRDPDGLYKEGRSTAIEGGLLRIKDFVEEEFLITGIEEGQQNNNVATIDARGRTERSTHAENMVPNGMVGALLGIDVKTQKPIKVSAGTIPHSLRVLYFKKPDLIVGLVGKYKSFPKGVKDKPRFPTFQSLKIKSDIAP